MKFIPEEFSVYRIQFDPTGPEPFSKNYSDHYIERSKVFDNYCSLLSHHDKDSASYNKRLKTINGDTTVFGRINYFCKKTVSTIKNEPTKGYKLLMSNNQLVLQHPLGFIIEITNRNVEEILNNCTITNNVIQEELFIDNSKFVLNKNFEKYKEQVKINSVDIHTPEIGSFYEVNVNYTPIRMQYIGRLHCMTAEEKRSTLQNIFRDNSDNIIICTDAFMKKNITFLNESASVPSDIVSFTQDKINNDKVLECPYKDVYSYFVVVVSDKPFKFENLYIDCKPKDFKIKIQYSKEHRYVFKYNDLYWVCTSKSCNGYYRYIRIDIRTLELVYSHQISILDELTDSYKIYFHL